VRSLSRSDPPAAQSSGSPATIDIVDASRRTDGVSNAPVSANAMTARSNRAISTCSPDRRESARESSLASDGGNG
jgi:hypothetical protein